MQPALARLAPSVVVDLIPYTERQAESVVRVFGGMAERIVALSSADVYRNYDGFRRKPTAPPDPVPLSEDAPLRESRYPYRGSGKAFEWADQYEKILVERVFMSNSTLPGTVLRLPAVYGPGDKLNRVGTYLDQLTQDQPVRIAPELARWRWTRGYVENVAAAVVLAVLDDRSRGRVYNVGEAPALTEEQWIREIGRAVGRIGDAVSFRGEASADDPGQAADYRYEMVTDTTRIREELGYSEPVDRAEALRRTVAWHRSP
jgi:nucleoside-diphosphate-sugar epimerase